MGLVRAVQAISVSITHKLLRNALAILAVEFIQGTRLGGYGNAQGGEHAVMPWLTPPYSSLFTDRICASLSRALQSHGGSPQGLRKPQHTLLGLGRLASVASFLWSNIKPVLYQWAPLRGLRHTFVL